jgi:hypothetical protein
MPVQCCQAARTLVMHVMWDGQIQVGDLTVVEYWHNKVSVITVVFEIYSY